MRPLARIPLVATVALMLFTSTASAQVGSDVLGSGGDVPALAGSVHRDAIERHRVRDVQDCQADRYDRVVRLQQRRGRPASCSRRTEQYGCRERRR